ncbi:MAG TPA: hypothetical protein VL947_03150, partial [Cytophagales bacterium]|nr:hypothetical protein [Cytophagales bacterium]
VLHHESRSLFLMHCLLEALERAKSKKPRYIIADGYWYKYYATEVSHGTSAAYLDKITAIFEVPDLLFYIRTTEQTTMERKTSFSRYECGFAEEPNAQSFSDFQHEAIAVLELLMASKDPVIVQGHDSPSECLNTVLQRLKIYHHENFYHYRN